MVVQLNCGPSTLERVAIGFANYSVGANLVFALWRNQGEYKIRPYAR